MNRFFQEEVEALAQAGGGVSGELVAARIAALRYEVELRKSQWMQDAFYQLMPGLFEPGPSHGFLVPGQAPRQVLEFGPGSEFLASGSGNSLRVGAAMDQPQAQLLPLSSAEWSRDPENQAWILLNLYATTPVKVRSIPLYLGDWSIWFLLFHAESVRMEWESPVGEGSWCGPVSACLMDDHLSPSHACERLRESLWNLPHFCQVQLRLPLEFQAWTHLQVRFVQSQGQNISILCPHSVNRVGVVDRFLQSLPCKPVSGHHEAITRKPSDVVCRIQRILRLEGQALTEAIVGPVPFDRHDTVHLHLPGESTWVADAEVSSGLVLGEKWNQGLVFQAVGKGITQDFLPWGKLTGFHVAVGAEHWGEMLGSLAKCLTTAGGDWVALRDFLQLLGNGVVPPGHPVNFVVRSRWNPHERRLVFYMQFPSGSRSDRLGSQGASVAWGHCLGRFLAEVTPFWGRIHVEMVEEE